MSVIEIAPEFDLWITGIPTIKVNTRKSGSRCGTTGSGRETTRDTRPGTNGWTRIKRRAAQGAGNTRTALTRPIPLGSRRPQEKGGQAVSKPRPLVYATTAQQAVTNAVLSVADLTVSVVAD